MGVVCNLSQIMVFYAIAPKGLKCYCKIVEVFLELAFSNYNMVWKKLYQSNQDN